MAFTSWLNKGTLITLEDGSQKAIESIEVDDLLQTFDMSPDEFDSAHIENNEQSNAKVKEITENTVDGGDVSTITFDNGSKLTLTNDYPIYAYAEQAAGWLTNDIEATKTKYGNTEGGDDRWEELVVESKVFLDGDDIDASVTNIEAHTEGTNFSMYTIESLEKGDVVFANNVLVISGEAF
jgi:hypothetical protein